MPKVIMGVARFNNETWEENKNWRIKNNFTGCIYGVDKEMPSKVAYGSNVFVFEMNNSTNQIMGVGVVQNIYRSEYRRKIYENDNYNRYIYKGTKYKSREELLNLNTELIENVEKILFTGSRHFKRGHGITIIPPERFGTEYKEKQRKKTQCGRCGQLGHNARSCTSKVRVLCKNKESCKKKCKYCGKLDKGHICPRFKVNYSKIREVILFLNNLFN